MKLILVCPGTQLDASATKNTQPASPAFDLFLQMAEMSATSTRKAEWFRAMRWRRRVAAAFADARLTFTQWLVLEAARELIAEHEDAVNQNQIAARVELDRSTVCQVMLTLQDKSLVSRDIDITDREMRIWLSSEAMQLLDEYRGRLEAISGS